MDYYSTLGLSRGASDADIKKAYRSMAMKHHPDRGGDANKFKEISQAYEFLSDPEKKRIIDMGGDPNSQGGFRQPGSPFEFHFNTGNFDDIFGNFGFGQRPMRRNKTLSINVEITLEDVLAGKEINAEIGMPGSKKKMINIHVPAGIEHGQQIRYEGMGDHSMQDLRPGDLIVNIVVRPHNKFKREGSSIVVDQEISVWDALLGCSINIKTLDNKTLDINVPPGTQSETVFSCRGEGLPNARSRVRGNLLIKLKVIIPRNLSSEQQELIKKVKQHGI
jgi:DnaJ-class molecular chaperone